MQSPKEFSQEATKMLDRSNARSNSCISPQPPKGPKTSRLIRGVANPKLLDSLSASKRQEAFNVTTIVSKIAKELEKDDSLVKAIKRKEKKQRKLFEQHLERALQPDKLASKLNQTSPSPKYDVLAVSNTPREKREARQQVEEKASSGRGMLPLINSRTNLSEFANEKMHLERKKERAQLKSRIKLRYGSPILLESNSVSPIGQKQARHSLFNSQIDFRRSVGQNFSTDELNKLSGMQTPHQHRSSTDNILRLSSSAGRHLFQREMSSNRKGKQKVSFQNFWDNTRDYRLPLAMEQVEVALKSKPEWNRNINRFTHSPVTKENSLKDMLRTLPCHYGDYTVKAGMNERDQALLMIGWLQHMKQSADQTTYPSFLKKMEALKKIFLLFLKQLSRQLGISCNERGIQIDCAGIFAEEYFLLAQEFISTKEQVLEETMKIRERELNEILELKQTGFERKLALLETEQMREHMENERVMLEKDSAIKLLREKNKNFKAKCKLYQELIETSSKKYLKGLQELNYQQMHLLGLSLKNSKLTHNFTKLKEGPEIELQDAGIQINDEDYREAFRQMRDSVAVNASKQILSRAYQERRKMSADHYSILSDQDQRDALRCIGEYPVAKLHQILVQYENKPLTKDQEAQYQEVQEPKQEMEELNQFELLMNENQERNLQPPEIFFQPEIKVTENGQDNYPSMKSKMSLHSLLEENQRDDQDKLIGATGMLVTSSKEHSRAASKQSNYRSSNFLFAGASYLEEVSQAHQIPKIIKVIEDSPLKHQILDRIDQFFKPMTYDVGVQTHEIREKKSTPAVSEDKRKGQQPFRFFRSNHGPRVHPASKFILTLAQKIKKNPALLKEINPSITKIIKKVCQFFLERYLSKDSRQCMLEYIYDQKVNTYGILSMAEKKLSELLLDIFVTTKRHASIEIFARFASISSEYYTMDDLECFFRLIDLIDQVSPAKRTSSISPKAQELVKFLPRQIYRDACFLTISQIIYEGAFQDQMNTLRNKIVSISQSNSIGADKQPQTAPSPLDLYVFIGLFINNYHVIKSKIRLIFEKENIIEPCSQADPQKYFFSRSEFRQIVREAKDLGVLLYYDQASLVAYFQRVSVIPIQNQRFKEGDTTRSSPSAGVRVNESLEITEQLISLDHVLGFVARMPFKVPALEMKKKEENMILQQQ